MRYRTIATLAACLTFINAIFFLFAPVLSLSLLGRTIDPTGQVMVRLAGACALGLGVMTWLLKNADSPQVRRAVSLGNLLAFGTLMSIDLLGLTMKVINGLGWFIFLADCLLFFAFLISIFTDGGLRR
jgi:hypothetical protein